jgi:zinc/manganese transport system substrate-binding protein/zinc transport system substrate-binding protein
VIVRQPIEPAKLPEFLAAKSGARVIVLAASVGALPEATDYIALLDYDVKQLALAWTR